MKDLKPERPRAPRRDKQRPRALVASRDSQLANFVARYFRSRDYEVVIANTRSETPPTSASDWQIAVVDVASRDDLSTLGEIADTLQVPTLAVSPDASREAVVELLRAGADLVLAKPFTLDALDAHVEALLRRTEGTGFGRFRGRYADSDLVVDFAAHTVTLAGERLRLSATQYRILECLCRNAGAVVTATELSDAVWGPDYNASSVLIRSHIRNLRRLLRDSAANPRYIHTETQIGYWVPKGDEET